MLIKIKISYLIITKQNRAYYKFIQVFLLKMVYQSSSFLNEDLLKATSDKNGKKIFSYWDILRTLIFGAISGGISRTITAPL